LSKQTSQFPEGESRSGGMHHKRKGKYEVWKRYIGEHRGYYFYFGYQNWHKHRSYQDRTIAEKNISDWLRKDDPHKIGKVSWEYEIREK
jgi:hypothetical protein